MPAAPMKQAAQRHRLGRKRCVVGWMLIVVGMLTAGVWGASRWWSFGYSSLHLHMYAAGGSCFLIVRGNPTGWHRELGWSVETREVWYGWRWFIPANKTVAPEFVDGSPLFIYWDMPEIEPRSSFRRLDFIPWPFALTALTGGTWLLLSARRARRRAITNACLNCGYYLAGLSPNSPCPECGCQQLIRAAPPGSPAG